MQDRPELEINSYTLRIRVSDTNDSSLGAIENSLMAEGLSKTIVSNGGTRFVLPSEEYVCHSVDHIFTLENRVVRALRRHTGSFSVLITHSAGRVWWGLIEDDTEVI